MADEAIADIDQAPFTQAREQHLEADVRLQFHWWLSDGKKQQTSWLTFVLIQDFDDNDSALGSDAYGTLQLFSLV